MSDANQRRFYRSGVEELRQISQNDEDFLCQLYESFVDLVYRYFHNQLQNFSKAEQLVYTQKLTRETFMRVVENLGHELSLWGNKPLTLWLFDIMNRTLREHNRELGQRLVDAHETRNQRATNMSAENQGEASSHENRQDALWLLVETLPVPEQQVLILRHVYKLSDVEVAGYLGEDVPTCKLLHTQALKNLRDLAREANLLSEVSKEQ
jgi:RNA polymerase sigma factor (sigma-70 family)